VRLQEQIQQVELRLAPLRHSKTTRKLLVAVVLQNNSLITITTMAMPVKNRGSLANRSIRVGRAPLTIRERAEVLLTAMLSEVSAVACRLSAEDNKTMVRIIILSPSHSSEQGSSSIRTSTTTRNLHSNFRRCLDRRARLCKVALAQAQVLAAKDSLTTLSRPNE